MVSDRLFTFLYSGDAPPPGVVYPTSQEEWARETLGRVEREVGYDQLKAMLPWLTEIEYQDAAEGRRSLRHPVSALRRILVETSVYESSDVTGSPASNRTCCSSTSRAPTASATSSHRTRRPGRIGQSGRLRPLHDVPERYFAASIA